MRDNRTMGSHLGLGMQHNECIFSPQLGFQSGLPTCRLQRGNQKSCCLIWALATWGATDQVQKTRPSTVFHALKSEHIAFRPLNNRGLASVQAASLIGVGWKHLGLSSWAGLETQWLNSYTSQICILSYFFLAFFPYFLNVFVAVLGS
jgi:hypothetical protein